MTIITMGTEEIRDSYFCDADNDHESFPTVNRTTLLSEVLEVPSENLDNDLLGWNFRFIQTGQVMWYSEEHLAAFLKFRYEIWTEIFLFTFASLDSLKAGVAEIEQHCRRQR